MIRGKVLYTKETKKQLDLVSSTFLAVSSPVHSYLLALGSWNNSFHLRHCNVSGGSQGFSFYGVFVSPLSRAIFSKVEWERRSYCRLPSSLEDFEWLYWINDSDSRKDKLAFTFFQSFRPRHGETNLSSFLSHIALLSSCLLFSVDLSRNYFNPAQRWTSSSNKRR